VSLRLGSGQVVGPPCRTARVEGVRGCSPRRRVIRIEGPTVSDGMASCGRDAAAITRALLVMGDQPGAIVAGFDVHRRHITVDALDTATGEVSRGQIESTPAAVDEWVAGFPGRAVHVAVEGCTGRLFACRALERCGAIVHLPSRWRPALCGVASTAPRPTAPTPDGARARHRSWSTACGSSECHDSRERRTPVRRVHTHLDRGRTRQLPRN
jgi:hypothetical protein